MYEVNTCYKWRQNICKKSTSSSQKKKSAKRGFMKSSSIQTIQTMHVLVNSG
jgi:hypothetical protein